ncbi:MAG: YjjG family noncanonical pyrimidine nucleotidase [Spirochaetia bacterium]|nr:YjjG family noncanonical pyrimidine nucleotidase [Spirochaetia bacterium]
MAYTHLFFDADGTLFDFNTSEKKALEKTVRRMCGIWKPELADMYHQQTKRTWMELEKKLITLERLKTLRFERFKEVSGLDFDVTEMSKVYIDFLSQSDDLFPGTVELLEGLYKKYTLVLATNGITSVQRGRIAATGTEKYFKGIVISEEVGVAKPDPEFFRLCAEKGGNPPKENILMIGDSMTSDMRGAANYGIASCMIVPPHKAMPAIEECSPRPDYLVRNFASLKEILR